MPEVLTNPVFVWSVFGVLVAVGLGVFIRTAIKGIRCKKEGVE